MQLSFNPNWSIVFDAGLCVAVLWLAYSLSRHGPFRGLGVRPLLGAGVVLCVPVLWLGEVFSLVTSLIVVPWLAIEAYGDTERPLPGALRALLAAARIAVFLLVIVCLLRPRLTYQSLDVHRGCAAILGDASASMRPKNCQPDDDRFGIMKSILKKNEDKIEDIEDKYDCRFATFAETFERREDLPEAPTGARTDLAGAFDALMRDLGGAKRGGVVLLSDGRHNVDEKNAKHAAELLGAPVHVICLGKKAEGTADSSIQSVHCPETVYLENVAPITVVVLYTGPKSDETVDVELAIDGEVIDSKPVPLPKPGKTVEVRFQYEPKTKGSKKLTATVTAVQGDRNSQNNSKQKFIEASDAELKVRLIEGKVRWEYKFLRRAIASAQGIKLDCVRAFLADESDRSTLLPEDKDGWKKLREELNLIILGDIPAARFSREQLEGIKEFVSEGGSLLMLGGFGSLGPGGYASTPVAAVLPVIISDQDGQAEHAVQVVLTDEASDYDILEFGSDKETHRVWAQLPPVSGYTKVKGVKRPGATVLLETKKEHAPILVVQKYGKGRAGVFTADTTWRWIFNEQGQFEKYHKAFWRQYVQWLTQSGYGKGGGEFWCKPKQRLYQSGEIPRLVVRARGERFEGANISAVITGPEGTEPFPMKFPDAPLFEEQDLPEPVIKPGRYDVVVTATLTDAAKAALPEKDRADPVKRNYFNVQGTDIEGLNPEPNWDLLREIAEATGGKVCTADNADEAFQAILDRDVNTRISRPRSEPLWDNIVMYIALGALLCTEWAVRKRKGLA